MIDCEKYMCNSEQAVSLYEKECVPLDFNSYMGNCINVNYDYFEDDKFVNIHNLIKPYVCQYGN